MTKESVASTVNDVAIPMADSEGEHSNIPSQSKHVTCSADTVHATTHRDIGGMGAASGFNEYNIPSIYPRKFGRTQIAK